MEQQENIPVIRKKRELKYTGTILKFYEDTVVVNRRKNFNGTPI